MENKFFCPICRANLNVSNHIIFATENKNGQPGLLLLNREVGVYSVEKNDDYTYNDGEQLDFFCPACHADLTAHEVNQNLAAVMMVDQEEKEHKILFSMIAGEKCTYKITEGTYEAFGESSAKYINFFNLSLR